jgi:mannan polymerase II complex MNN11 subunit
MAANERYRWHGTILAKLALLPQNTFNAYKIGNANPKNGQYTNGDFVAGFPGCDKDKRNCADEMKDTFEAIEKAS